MYYTTLETNLNFPKMRNHLWVVRVLFVSKQFSNYDIFKI